MTRAHCWFSIAALVIGCRPASAPQKSSELAAPVRARLQRQLATTVPASRGPIVVAALDRKRDVRVVLGDEDLVFEIGSVTKAFTGVLLADEVLRGRVKLSDTAQEHLPSLTLPKHPGGPIRVVHLATYTSGLPFMPTNWVTVDEGVYTDAMWREFLSTYAPNYAPGDKFIYGNVGFGVLGDLLATREGTSLHALFRERIFQPLGMNSTWFLGARKKDARVAQGFDEDGKPVPLDHDKPLQAGCCAIESTASDLLKFLDAALTASPLHAAFDLAVSKHVGAARIGESHDVGLGWFLPSDESFAEKGGIMKGYRSAIVLDRREQVAVVVLAADARFPADELARRVRMGVVLERSLPPLPIVDALPKEATTTRAAWNTGLELMGWTAPPSAKRGATIQMCLYFRAGKELALDYRVFVHGESKGAPRVRADHDPLRPTSDWPTGRIVRDCFALAVPETQPPGPMTIWAGLFSGPRMKLLTPSDGKDRVRGPLLEIE